MRIFLGCLLVLLFLLSPAYAVDLIVGTTGTVAGVTDGDKGDLTVSSSGTVWTIDTGAVTYAKIQNVSATARLLGRNAAGAGPIEELSSTTVKTMLGLSFGDLTGSATDAQIPDLNTLSTGLTASRCVQTDGTGLLTVAAAACGTGGAGVTDGDKGDITVSGSGAVWTIDAGVVTYAKMQNVSATARLLGRVTAGAGPTEELTAAQAKTVLAVTFPDVSGSASVAQLPPAARAAIALTFVRLGGS